MNVKRCQLLTFNFTFNIHQKQNVLYREKKITVMFQTLLCLYNKRIIYGNEISIE